MPTAAWLIVVWLFVVGGVVGSFLNVVVYRLPLGISLIHPPSHCPKCGKPIRWYDNVPDLRLDHAAGPMPAVPQSDFRAVSGGRGHHGRDVRVAGGRRDRHAGGQSAAT